MRVLLAYHSEYGNTAKIANAIALGMKAGGVTDIVVKGIQNATPDDFRSAEVWVIGGPTHIGSPTGEVKKALRTAIEAGAKGKRGVAFDTRFRSSPKGALSKIEILMTEGGMDIAVPGEYFAVVKSKGPLADGEEAKAEAFGKKIAATIAH